jgi:hypothetical protein
MALGMPTAGAMDRIALTLANALVGNPAGTAAEPGGFDTCATSFILYSPS